MSSCTSCGHQLGVGRFCTNCGAPVDSSTPDGTPVSTPVTPDGDWRTDTAERRLSAAAADPRTPPAAVAPPPPPRYPLFADEVEGYTPYGPLDRDQHRAGAGGRPRHRRSPSRTSRSRSRTTSRTSYEYDEERRSPVLWILAAALVLVLVAAGWWFLVRDDGADPAADDGGNGPSAEEPATAARTASTSPGAPRPRRPRPRRPTRTSTATRSPTTPATCSTASPTPPGARPGDGTGMELTFTLREPTELHQVGLVNGYAKTSTDDKGRTFDWYLGNRRIQAVVWVFDDGSKVRQELDRDPRAADRSTSPTSSPARVVLRIVAVSPPGEGSAARDFTAISEVSFLAGRLTG